MTLDPDKLRLKRIPSYKQSKEEEFDKKYNDLYHSYLRIKTNHLQTKKAFEELINELQELSQSIETVEGLEKVLPIKSRIDEISIRGARILEKIEHPTMKINYANPLHEILFPPTKKDGTPLYENVSVVSYKRIVTEENLEQVLNEAFPDGDIPVWSSRVNRPEDAPSTFSKFIEKYYSQIEGFNRIVLVKIKGNSTFNDFSVEEFDALAENVPNFLKKDNLPIVEARNWAIQHAYETDINQLPHSTFQKIMKKPYLVYEKTN